MSRVDVVVKALKGVDESGSCGVGKKCGGGCGCLVVKGVAWCC